MTIEVVSACEWVCVDCLFWIAYGDEPEDPSDWTPPTLPDGQHWIAGGIGPDTEEPAEDIEFSWRPCDACGSHLGGSRHPACIVQHSRSA